jgi:photosystem II stability/assembly factor-like uncharacterized protein
VLLGISAILSLLLAGCGGGGDDASEGPVAANPCDASSCRTPPSPLCIDASRLRTFAGVGTCAGGECTYATTVLTCANGCQGGACVADPCGAITCNTPPPSECADPAHLRTFAAVGTCSGGACTYAGTKSSCASGCQNGACAASPCDGVTCLTPPPTACVDDNTLRTFAAAGTCEGGDCSYAPTDTACPMGCAAGACLEDPCAAVTCDAPPASTCADPSTLRTFATAGTCDGGGCTYAPTDTACSMGCASGACKGDPCAAVVCETPPSPECADEQTRRTFASSGTCSNGSCSYAQTDSSCDFGCMFGKCNGDPCAKVTCAAPPPTTCADASTLRSYPAIGTCSDALCSYAPSDTPCDTPPPTDCAGPSSVRTYGTAGSCSSGACKYPTTVTSCVQPPHAKASCQGGECPISACDAGFADCDGLLDSGCEADLLSGAQNCGACGVACEAGDTCFEGQCQLVWQTQSSGTSSTLRGVWGSASDDVYVVGGSGTILHTSNSGAAWLPRTLGAAASLQGVWGSGADDIYVVGTSGRIFHSSDGGLSWPMQTSGTSAALYAVWGSASDDVFVVGAGGAILHSTNGGGAWQAQSAPTTVDLHAVWGFGGGDIFAGGNNGTIVRTSDHGATWVSIPNPSTYRVNGFWGASAGDMFAAAGETDIINGIATIFARLVHTGNNGGTWTTEQPGPSASQPLEAVWGSAASDVYAAGGGGKIIRTVDGKSWKRVRPPSSSLHGLWGSGPRDVYAVGFEGLILHGH